MLFVVILLFFVNAMLATGIMIVLLPHRTRPGAEPFSQLALGIGIWSVAHAIEIISGAYPVKIFFSNFKYIGITAVPVSWFFFALEHATNKNWLTPRRRILFFIEPLLAIILAFTSPYHNWFKIVSGTVQYDLYSTLIIGVGPLFWVHTVYSYALILVGTFILIRTLRNSADTQTMPIFLLLIAAVVPWITNAAYVLGFEPFPGIELTPIAFIVSGAALGWNLYSYRLVNLLPIARSVVVDQISDAVIVLDQENAILDVNPVALKLFGWQRAAIIRQPVDACLAEHRTLSDFLTRSGAQQMVFNTAIDGSEHYFDVLVTRLRNRAGVVQGRVVILRDITTIKLAELALNSFSADLQREVARQTANLQHTNQQLEQEIRERQRIEDELRRSLAEKDVLLKEVHHRVKNNLQIISSLLNLQSNAVDDERMLAQFQDSQSRIRSMALIHERLYRSHIFASIAFGDYLNDLVATIMDTYRKHAQAVHYVVHADPVPLDLDTAIPSGLIVTELVSNALKYAFPNGQRGNIQVWFTYNDAEGMFHLAVEDDGVGLPQDFDMGRTHSLGMQLVQSLTRQLGGTLLLKRLGQGTRFEIRFPARQLVETPPPQP
ncbi:MAG: histidine kinase N-terminal 7TM domain-containing protein [Anaerolineae bacterium]